MATYARKTEDEYRLMINYGFGHGWEHETTEETLREAKEQQRTYRGNCPEYPTKIVKKRVKIDLKKSAGDNVALCL